MSVWVDAYETAKAGLLFKCHQKQFWLERVWVRACFRILFLFHSDHSLSWRYQNSCYHGNCWSVLIIFSLCETGSSQRRAHIRHLPVSWLNARSDHSKLIFSQNSFSGAKTNKTCSVLYYFWFASHLILESTYQYYAMLNPCAHANVSRPTQLHNSLLFSICAIMMLITQIYLNDPQFSVAVTLSNHSL